MSGQNVQPGSDCAGGELHFLPDPNEIPRTLFASACALSYATLAGLLAGNGNFGFVIGLGAACGLGLHRVATRRDWALRRKIPRP